MSDDPLADIRGAVADIAARMATREDLADIEISNASCNHRIAD
jgi:hypothetical protein